MPLLSKVKPSPKAGEQLTAAIQLGNILRQQYPVHVGGRILQGKIKLAFSEWKNWFMRKYNSIMVKYRYS